MCFWGTVEAHLVLFTLFCMVQLTYQGRCPKDKLCCAFVPCCAVPAVTTPCVQGMPMLPQGGAYVSHHQRQTCEAGLAGPSGEMKMKDSLMEPSDAIRAEHIITRGELELFEPIGRGAEAMVRPYVGMGSAQDATHHALFCSSD